MLLLAIGAVAWEAVKRLQAPQAVDGRTLMIVAAVGIAIGLVRQKLTYLQSHAEWQFWRG